MPKPGKAHNLCAVIVAATVTVTVVTLAALPAMALAQGLNLPSTVLDRVAQQQADRAQQQVADRAQTQAADKAVDKAVDKTVEKAQQQIDNAQQRANDKAQAQQENKVQVQVVDRVGNQVERAQTQAAERAQTAAERAQSQLERTRQRAEQAQGKAAEKAAEAAEKSRVAATRAEERPLAGAAAVVTTQTRDNGNGDSNDTTGSGNGAGATTTLAQNAQNPVRTPTGSAAFVEVTLQPGVRAIEFQWVMMVTPQQRLQLNTDSTRLMQFLTDSQPNALAGGELLTFTVPPDLDANDAILELVPANLRGQIDRNHLYATQSRESRVELPLAQPFAAVCEAPVIVGMIDSAIDDKHPAFAQLGKQSGRIQSRSFVEDTLVPSTTHGTTIASVLVGNHEGPASTTLHPLLPRATLYSAGVFHESGNALQGATVSRLLAALDWLINVPGLNVINMSLAGPPNRLLAQAVATARQRGKLIVAATGNEGPNAPPRYPAAYNDVIGVTAVDRDAKVFRWANQGPQVHFAALGVNVPGASGKAEFAPQTGTSVAAPVVSAFLACAMQRESNVDAALAAVDKLAIDLGKPGKDTVFGQGLLHPGLPPLLSTK